MPPRRRRTIRQAHRGNTPAPARGEEKVGEIQAEAQYIIPDQRRLNDGDIDQEALQRNAAPKPDIGRDAYRPDLTHMSGASPVDNSLFENGQGGADSPYNQKGGARSDQELAADETNAATDTPTDAAAEKELAALPASPSTNPNWYSGNEDERGAPKRGRKALQIARKLKRGRLLLVGAGALTSVAIIMAGFFGSLEAINVRENMLGKGNRLVNQVLDNRRGRSVARMMRNMSKGDFRQRLNNEKLATKLRSQGFKIDFDDAGKVKEFGFTHPQTGEYRALDLADTDYRRSARGFFGSEAGDFGREASIAFDSASGVRAATWKGKAARRLYAKMRVTFADLTNEPRMTADDAEPEDVGSTLNDLDKKDNAELAQANKTSNPADTDGNGTVDDADEPSQTAYDGADELTDQTVAANEAIANGDGIGESLGIDESLGDAIQAKDIADAAGKGATTAVLSALRDSLTNKFPNLKSSLGRAVKAIDLAEAPRIACRVKGTLNFATNIRNVMMAAELARFAVRYLTVADSQKAGLVNNTGMNLFMTYLHTPSPVTGQTYLNDGGLQNIVFGDTTAKPSAANLGRYSTARADMGILGSIRSFLNKVPLTGSGTCKTLNNGFVQIGTALVGIGAAFISGGTITAGSVGLSLSLGVIEEVAFAVATPLIVKSVTGSILDGHESGLMAGGALASGFGSLRGMNANSNGLRPVTKTKAAMLRQEADATEAYAAARESIFERYLDPYKSDSLMTKVAFAVPRQPASIAASIRGSLSNLNFASLFTRLPFGASASAQEETEDPCLADPQIAALDLETDVYCNIEFANAPDLNTDTTEEVLRNHTATRIRSVNGKCVTETVEAPLIDIDGRAVPYPDGDPKCDGTIYMSDDLNDYIGYCLSGRTGILYDTTDQAKVLNGSADAIKASMHMHDPFQDVKNPCVEDGEPLSNEVESIGRFARYTDWYAYKYVDEDNFVEDINEEYAGNGTDSSGVPASIISGDTTSIACRAGSDMGAADGYRDGALVKIRICNVQGIAVNSQISYNVDRLLNAARADGVSLSGGGFRDMATQERLYRENCPGGACSPPTARPGHSNHQMGLAIDFSYNGGTICFPSASDACRDAGNKGFEWLESNASRFGLSNLPSEAWHWSLTGD